ncbi:MAG: acetoin utilization protein AcuC [Rhodospirillales bacterium]|nr:acetoin utilization protein AcuC [Rhodospirillales bacterium]
MTQRTSSRSSAKPCRTPATSWRPDPVAGRPRFIGSEIYRSSSYGTRHPLAIPRVSTCIDLCRVLGWLPDEVYLDSPRATAEQLCRFHAADYVAALIEAERRQSVPPAVRRRYNIGCNGNPIFPEIFRRPATACGGSILAARLIAEGGRVYNPAGGTHHGQADRASGFCYLNDPVLAILTLLDGGVERVLYLDVDAHHGDGVQAAFAEDPRVLTVSIHEAGRWPMSERHGGGAASDRAGGAARNLPVPAGLNDSEMAFLLEAAVLPLAEAFEPEAVVLQCGADALEDDPLSRLSLSNLALWHVVEAVRGLAPRLLVLGGGGYNPWSVARCWAGVWGRLNGYEAPERLPSEAEAVLRALRWRHRSGRQPPERWFVTLADRPRPGPIRPEVRDIARSVLALSSGL